MPIARRTCPTNRDALGASHCNIRWFAATYRHSRAQCDPNYRDHSALRDRERDAAHEGSRVLIGTPRRSRNLRSNTQIAQARPVPGVDCVKTSGGAPAGRQRFRAPGLANCFAPRPGFRRLSRTYRSGGSVSLRSGAGPQHSLLCACTKRSPRRPNFEGPQITPALGPGRVPDCP